MTANIGKEWEQALTDSAQAMLDARKIYEDQGWTLADMYDPSKMPKELRAAHHKNDVLVNRFYGLQDDATKEEQIAVLMWLYQEKTAGRNCYHVADPSHSNKKGDYVLFSVDKKGHKKWYRQE